MVSLHWCKDHDVNELVNKLRFHKASNINQKRTVAMQNERLIFKYAASITCKILHIPCNMKGSIFQRSQIHAK